MTLPDPLQILWRLAEELDTLAVRYLVGGSVASSLHGIPRTTQDADVVAELGEEHIEPLVTALRDDFHIEASAVREAVRQRGSFNVIYLPAIFKVDIFVKKRGEFADLEMDRREVHQLSAGSDLRLAIATAEDTVLHKLLWFRRGGEVSQRQWRDALGVVKVQGEHLDQAHLDRWAKRLGLADLLDRLRRDAGMNP